MPRYSTTALISGLLAGVLGCADEGGDRCEGASCDADALEARSTAQAWAAPIVVDPWDGLVTATIETSQYVYLPSDAPADRAYDVVAWMGEPTFAVYHWDWEGQSWILGEDTGAVLDYGGPPIMAVVTNAPVTVAIGYLSPVVALGGCLWLDDQDQQDEDEPPDNPPPDPDPDHDEDFGERCGAISTVVSLVKLGWVTEAAIKEGNKFKPTALTQFDGSIDEGMDQAALTAAHEAYVPKGHKLVHKSHAGVAPEATDAEWAAYWTEVKQLSDAGWDCLLTMHGSDEFDHVEQIETILVSQDGKKVKVTTKDALKQGGLFGQNVDYPPAKNKVDLERKPKLGGVDGTQVVPGGSLSKTKDREIYSVNWDCYNSEPVPKPKPKPQ